MFKMLGAFCQKLLDIISSLLGWVVNLLPDSPFSIIQASGFGSLLSDINYFIPIYEFLAIGQAWLICVGVYYLYSVIARWVKAIE